MRLGLDFGDWYEATTRIASPEDLRRTSVHMAEEIGFTTVSVMAVKDRAGTDPLFSGVDNTPDSYRDLFENYEDGLRDPVMQHCKVSSLPIVWDQATYASADCGEKWEEMAPHGYSTGVAIAHHLPGGRHLFVGVDRPQALPACRTTLRRMVADLCLYVTMVHEPALHFLIGGDVKVDHSLLSTRELEALRWTMDGKTAWEVGRILSISEQTAARHLNNATRKLDCTNKHHAVVKALRLGLIR